MAFRFQIADIPKKVEVIAETYVEIFGDGPKDGLMKPEVAVVDVVGAVGGRIAAQAMQSGMDNAEIASRL